VIPDEGVYPLISWADPWGVYHRALKTVAEVVEGSINDLLWDLMLYRYAV
jgi:hypothetical protein